MLAVSKAVVRLVAMRCGLAARCAVFAILGLVIASVVGMFWRSAALEFLISVVGVLVYDAIVERVRGWRRRSARSAG